MGVFSCGNKHVPGTIEKLTPNFYHGDMRLSLKSPGYFSFRAICRCCGVVFEGTKDMPNDTVLNEYIRGLMTEKAATTARANGLERDMMNEKKRVEQLTSALNDTSARRRELDSRLEDARVRERNLQEDFTKARDDARLYQTKYREEHEQNVDFARSLEETVEANRKLLDETKKLKLRLRTRK